MLNVTHAQWWWWCCECIYRYTSHDLLNQHLNFGQFRSTSYICMCKQCISMFKKIECAQVIRFSFFHFSLGTWNSLVWLNFSKIDAIIERHYIQFIQEIVRTIFGFAWNLDVEVVQTLRFYVSGLKLFKRRNIFKDNSVEFGYFHTFNSLYLSFLSNFETFYNWWNFNAKENNWSYWVNILIQIHEKQWFFHFLI